MKHGHFGNLALIAASLVIASSASAATYNFSSSGLGITATITTSNTFDSVLNGYDITGISGTTLWGAITGLQPTSSPGYVAFTGGGTNVFPIYNVFTPGSDPLGGGVAFNLTPSPGIIGGALWSNGSATDYGVFIGNWNQNQNGAGTIAAVPEPETFAMLLSGLGLIGMISRRRSAAAANA